MNKRATATLAAGVAAMLALPGCASDQAQNMVPSASSNNECQIDANRICGRVKGQPMLIEHASSEINTAPATNVLVSLSLPSGKQIAFRCDINFADQSTVYGRLAPGQSLTDQDIEELRQQGLCTNSGEAAASMSNQPTAGSGATPLAQSSAPFVSEPESGAAVLQFASVTPPPGAQTTHAPWLMMVNRWRSAVHLPPVPEDPALSEGDRKHAQYLVATYSSFIRAGHLLGAEMHTEDPRNPLYTQESLAAAQKSDVADAMTPSGALPPWWALAEWTAGPFHRAPILDPFLSGVGYDESCRNQVCFAALNVGSDASLKAGMRFRSPIVFPPDHAVINMQSFAGEWPDPLTSCPGYSAPAGFPITFQTGSWVMPKLSSFSMSVNGAAVEACGFDPESYRNPDPPLEKRGRLVLKDYGMVVIIPRQPLMAGGIYTVKAVIDGHQHVTSFTVNPNAGGQ